jgi:hypothetical protein
MGNSSQARPRGLGLPDIAELISSHVLLRQRQSKTSYPTSKTDERGPVTPYNVPTPKYPLGFMNHWCQYGFDGRFLSRVIFPSAVKRWKLCSWCPWQGE